MTVTTLHGDCLDILPTLPERSVQCVITSPPYFGLRRYTDDPREIGNEPTYQAYVAALVVVFREVWRVLRDDGTLWLNLGDSYANGGGQTSGKHSAGLQGTKFIGRNRHTTGLPSKSLIGLPWRVAFALQDEGWVLRNDIIWHKLAPMPESVKDRFARDHEYLFLFAKQGNYYFNHAAVDESGAGTVSRPQYRRALELARAGGLTAEHIAAIRASGSTDTGRSAVVQNGTGKNSARVQALAAEAKQALGGYYREFLLSERRNRRTVWTIAPQHLSGTGHFASYPEALVEPCILAGSQPGDTVLDPFAGSGTTLRVAERLQRNSIGIDLNQDYIELQKKRTDGVQVEMSL